MNRSTLPIVILVILCSASLCTAQKPDGWHLENPFYQGWLRDVVATPEGFLAAGNYTLIESVDGASWQEIETPNEETAGSIASNGAVIIASTSSNIYRKEGGGDWTQIPGSLRAEEVRWLNGHFIAVGYDGKVHISDAGFDWTTIPTPLSQTLTDVSWNGSYYVACAGGSHPLDPRIVYSNDAMTWNPAVTLLGIDEFESINILDIASDGSRFVAITDDEKIVYSDFPSTWQVVDIGGGAPAEFSRFNSIAWDGTKFVAVGLGGFFSQSADGLSWGPFERISALDLNSVAFGHGMLVAVGQDGSVLLSDDGADWRGVSLVEGELFSVAFNGTEFCAAGRARDYMSSLIAYTSSDGVNWTNASPTIESGQRFPAAPQDLVWWRGGYYGVGFEFFHQSPDCASWTLSRVMSEDLSRIEATDYELVAIGNHSVFRRTTSTPWSKVQSIEPGQLRDVATDGERFIVVGDSGLILVSDSGAFWEEIDIRAEEDFSHIVYFTDRFFALSNASVWSSFNGTVWVREGDSGPCKSLFAGRGKLRCFGNFGFFESQANQPADWQLTTSDFNRFWYTRTNNVAESDSQLVAVMVDGNISGLPNGPTAIFEDDFESGNTIAWTAAVP